jgi:hypothetical protein
MRELQKRIALGIAAGCIALAAAAVAIGFLSLALFLAFAALMPPAWAAVVTAACVTLAAALIVAILRLAARPRRAPEPRRDAAGDPGDIAMELGSLFGQQAHGFATRHKGATILGSLALGFAIGVSPGLRDLLRGGR